MPGNERRHLPFQGCLIPQTNGICRIGRPRTKRTQTRSRPLPRPFDRLDRATDSTETASFRFARPRPPERDSVDSVDSVVMSTGRPAGEAAPYPGLSTDTTERPTRPRRPPSASRASGRRSATRSILSIRRDVDRPHCGGSRPLPRPSTIRRRRRHRLPFTARRTGRLWKSCARGRSEIRSHLSPSVFRARVVDVVDIVDVVDRPSCGGSRPLPRPSDRLDRATDSTETASFRFARLRPPKRASVDSVDSVVMSTGRPAGEAAPFLRPFDDPTTSTTSTPPRRKAHGTLGRRARAGGPGSP